MSMPYSVIIEFKKNIRSVMNNHDMHFLAIMLSLDYFQVLHLLYVIVLTGANL